MVMGPDGSFNAAAAAAVQQQLQLPPSPSPIPYLFGGLASMIGLVALALVALTCSYCKCFHYSQGEVNRARDTENPGEKPRIKVSPDLDEKIVVIMPGEQKPTFLANPVSSTSRASSFTDQSESKDQGHKNQENQDDDDDDDNP